MSKKKLKKLLRQAEMQRDELLNILIAERPEGFGWWYKRSLERAMEIRDAVTSA